MRSLVAIVALLGAVTSSDLAWSEHWDPGWELSFPYPKDWRLYTAHDPGPYGYFRSNQVAICTSPDHPDVGFNIGAIFGPPPQPFAARMEASLQGMTQRQGGTRLSFRSLTISGREAVELRQRVGSGTGATVQRVIAIAATSNGFMITFTAPESLADQVDRDVFSTVIDRLAIGEPSLVAFWRRLWSLTPRTWRSLVVGLAFAGACCFCWFVLRRRSWEVA